MTYKELQDIVIDSETGLFKEDLTDEMILDCRKSMSKNVHTLFMAVNLFENGEFSVASQLLENNWK